MAHTTNFLASGIPFLARPYLYLKVYGTFTKTSLWNNFVGIFVLLRILRTLKTYLWVKIKWFFLLFRFLDDLLKPHILTKCHTFFLDNFYHNWMIDDEWEEKINSSSIYEWSTNSMWQLACNLDKNTMKVKLCLVVANSV